jgi:hypothetical protein
MNDDPCYLTLDEARDVLGAMNIHLNERQMKRAAEKDGQGIRKLPFFVDPVDGRLKIEKRMLINIYSEYQSDAEKSWKSPALSM